jgi:hypothetical protein
MGDGIGWMQPRIYQRGLMVGENAGDEGAISMDYVAMHSYVAMRSCTSGCNAFFRHLFAAHGHDPAATQPSPCN